MKQLILFLLIVVSFFVLPKTMQAETGSNASDLPVNISYELDMALTVNTLDSSVVGETVWADSASRKAAEAKPIKLKSPTTALIIAIVPGSVVHGAGHFYAGKTRTAIGLFGAGIVGAGLTLTGALENIFEGMEGSENNDGADAALIIGLGLFAGSWIYDIIGAPHAVKNQNDKILGKKPFPYELNMQLDENNQQIKCLVVKRF